VRDGWNGHSRSLKVIRYCANVLISIFNRSWDLRKSMEKRKIWPDATPNYPYRSSQKIAEVIINKTAEIKKSILLFRLKSSIDFLISAVLWCDAANVVLAHRFKLFLFYKFM